jgi:hypothetical protein
MKCNKDCFSMLGKKVCLTYKDSAKYNNKVNTGVCIYDCNDMIGIRCLYSKQEVLISKSIIEFIKIEATE